VSLLRALTLLSAALSSAMLLGGFRGAEGAGWLPGIAAGGLAWLISEWRGWALPATLLGLGAFLLAAGGITLDLLPFLMAASAILAMAALHTGHYVRRSMAFSAALPDARLQGRFVVRLLAIELLSAALFVAGQRMTVQLRFLPALGLGLLLIIGVSRLVTTLRDQTL